jgi:hypothetical protein
MQTRQKRWHRPIEEDRTFGSWSAESELMLNENATLLTQRLIIVSNYKTLNV